MQPRNEAKRLVFAVTNELVYDQRMIRICSSLQQAGYRVVLVGRRWRGAPSLPPQPFQQKRLFCFFRKGKLFYAEYNLRLFLALLFQPMDLVCAIDLDSILPVYFASVLRQKKRVYDAHELFCEMKEIVTRPRIYAAWKRIERFAVPRFADGYTVCEPIRQVFEQDYGRRYEVIMNAAVLRNLPPANTERFIIYQGTVNEGRSFETLIPAFQWIDCPLHIYGSGNFLLQAQALIQDLGLQNKVFLKGAVAPDQLRTITPNALLGLTLFENKGQSNYFSLSNRFFDYIHAGIPQLCVDYPAYRQINNEMEVAVLVSDLSSRALATAINALLGDAERQKTLRKNCLKAREVLCWQAEEKKLLRFYSRLL